MCLHQKAGSMVVLLGGSLDSGITFWGLVRYSWTPPPHMIPRVPSLKVSDRLVSSHLYLSIIYLHLLSVCLYISDCFIDMEFSKNPVFLKQPTWPKQTYWKTWVVRIWEMFQVLTGAGNRQLCLQSRQSLAFYRPWTPDKGNPGLIETTDY